MPIYQISIFLRNADIPGRDTYEAPSGEEDKLSYEANGLWSLLSSLWRGG